jgi:transposase
MRVARPIVLDSDQRIFLTHRARARSLPARIVERSRIVLLAAEGKQDLEIGVHLGISSKKAARWRNRFLDAGVQGLDKDAPRRGRKPVITPSIVQSIIERTTQSRPANASRWTTRSMAAEMGISDSSVLRIWRAHGLKPHLTETTTAQVPIESISYKSYTDAPICS